MNFILVVVQINHNSFEEIWIVPANADDLKTGYPLSVNIKHTCERQTLESVPCIITSYYSMFEYLNGIDEEVLGSRCIMYTITKEF